MRVFTTDKIRNVVLLGHSGAGKSSLVAAMQKISGGAGRMGRRPPRRLRCTPSSGRIPRSIF